MNCLKFCNGGKREEAITPKPSSIRSSFTGNETRQSGSEFSSQDGSGTRAESKGHGQFPNSAGRPSNLKVFTFPELKQATRNFSNSAKLGEGGFGCVFKGVIKSSDDPAMKIDVAIKQLRKRGAQVYSL